MKTGGATSGSQPELATDFCDGIEARRLPIHIPKLMICSPQEPMSYHMRRIGLAIYGLALEKRAWLDTRITASSSSLPPTGFQQEQSRACLSIAMGGSGLHSARAVLLALTTRRRSARRRLFTQSPKGFQVTGCGALLRTAGAAST